METLERRLESTRKQAEMIIELENDVSKAQKQEKVYEEAIEQLQAEQDALEAENAKLRKGQGQAQGQGLSRDGMSSAGMPLMADRAAAAASSAFDMALSSTLGTIETSALADQVDNLRSALRFLRRENALLRSSEMYNTLHSLPLLSLPIRGGADVSLPDLEPSSLTSPSSSSDEHGPLTPTGKHRTRARSRGPTVTRQGLETETKLLLRDVAAFQTRPAIVDLSQAGRTGWRSRKKDPEQQLMGWRRKERDLQRRVEKLKERARALGLGGTAAGRR